MPPLTPEEQENDQTLDDKLGAFFESEMKDLAPDTSLAEPEPEAADDDLEAEAVAEDPADDETDEQPRDENGRFATKDEPRLFAGKYKSEEELEQAYLHLQSLQGKSSQELGELRRIVEEIQARQQTTPAPAGTVDQTQLSEYLEENPAAIHQTIQNAWAQNDRTSLYTAVAVLQDFDRAAAEAYRTEIAKQDALAAVRAEQATVTQQQAQIEGARDLAHQAYAALEASVGEIPPQVRQEMMEVASKSPRILAVLNGDDVESMVEMLDYLHTKAEKQTRGRDADTLAEATAAKTAEQKAAARQMKENAAVGSATATKEPQAKTGVDAWRENFHSVLFDNSTSIRSGLTTD